MKTADGGWLPAYNMQIISTPEHQVIVEVDIDTSGSDRGLAQPGIERVRAEGYEPSNYRRLHQERRHRVGPCQRYQAVCPAGQTKHGTDCYAPKKDDSIGVADWRERMQSEEGKAFYRLRAEHECINAPCPPHGAAPADPARQDQGPHPSVVVRGRSQHDALPRLARQGAGSTMNRGGHASGRPQDTTGLWSGRNFVRSSLAFMIISGLAVARSEC